MYLNKSEYLRYMMNSQNSQLKQNNLIKMWAIKLSNYLRKKMFNGHAKTKLDAINFTKTQIKNNNSPSS